MIVFWIIGVLFLIIGLIFSIPTFIKFIKCKGHTTGKIVSIDNSDLCVLSQVQLTSVEHPMEKLGKKVAEQFLQMLENANQDVTYEFQPEIVVRDSVCRYYEA